MPSPLRKPLREFAREIVFTTALLHSERRRLIVLNIFNLFRRLHWHKIVPLLPLAVGFAACDLCGGSVRLDGTNRCTQFGIASYQGMPYGPVTVKWKPTDNITVYTIEVYTKAGYAGITQVPSTETSATIIMDPAIVKQTMDTDGRFLIIGIAALATGGVGYCEFDYPIYIPKVENKQASPTPVQPPVVHQPPQPPPQVPSATPRPLPPPVFITPTPTQQVPG